MIFLDIRSRDLSKRGKGPSEGGGGEKKKKKKKQIGIRKRRLTFGPTRCRHVSITNIRQAALSDQLARVLQEGAKVPVALVVVVEAGELLPRLVDADVGPTTQPRVDLGVGAAHVPECVQVVGNERADEQAGGAQVRPFVDGGQGFCGEQGTEAEPGRHAALFVILQVQLDLEPGKGVLEICHGVHIFLGCESPVFG